jgi:hypothetical protein
MTCCPASIQVCLPNIRFSSSFGDIQKFTRRGRIMNRPSLEEGDVHEKGIKSLQKGGGTESGWQSIVMKEVFIS